MIKLIAKWLKIYEDELGLLLSAVALLFLVRVSGMLFNNFAETAFLKRFGVQYLPVMYMINSIAIFVIMGSIVGVMARLPGTTLLLRLLILCGTSVAAMRFVIPLGYDLVYPVLFILKTLYEALLGLLFWNLANDLFNTRQSKRLFPLITAGGVCGDILGGFGTPFLTRLVSIDNLLLVYLGTTLAAAVVVYSIGSNYPTLLIQDTGGKKKKTRSSIIRDIKNAIPLIKDSVLIKILVFMTFFPNVIIPIMNYLFNFAVNEQFATESGLVTFFGYFRGGDERAQSDHSPLRGSDLWEVGPSGGADVPPLQLHLCFYRISHKIRYFCRYLRAPVHECHPNHTSQAGIGCVDRTGPGVLPGHHPAVSPGNRRADRAAARIRRHPGHRPAVSSPVPVDNRHSVCPRMARHHHHP